MNSKPRLIDLDFLKKVSKSNIEKIQYSVTSKVSTYMTSSCLDFIVKYSDMIIVILILGIILYFRYKYNIESKKRKKKPDILEVNYHRTNDYENGKVIDTKDNIETSKETSKDLIDIIKDKINEFDNDLQPVDMNNFSSYSNI
jgi:hypothetical protein